MSIFKEQTLEEFEADVLATLCEHDRKLLTKEDMFNIGTYWESDYSVKYVVNRISSDIFNYLAAMP